MFLTMHSRNGKVGDVAATYAPIDSTCPDSCNLRDSGCYAQSGNVGFQVSRLQRETAGLNGDTVAMLEGDEIAHAANHAPAGHPLRIHVSGDATSDFRANAVARGSLFWPGPVWAYTHAWRDVSRKAWLHVSVLASCESLSDVIEAHARGYAAALVTKAHPADGRAYKLGTVKVIPCPSQTRGVKCTDCKLCFDADKLHAMHACIGFSAHGASRKRALKVIQGKVGQHG